MFLVSTAAFPVPCMTTVTVPDVALTEAAVTDATYLLVIEAAAASPIEALSVAVVYKVPSLKASVIAVRAVELIALASETFAFVV